MKNLIIGLFVVVVVVVLGFMLMSDVESKTNIFYNAFFKNKIQGTTELRGTDSFTTTATADTIRILGVTTSSVFVVSINDATPVANDLLSYTVKTDTLICHRPAGTTSGLSYSYIRID